MKSQRAIWFGLLGALTVLPNLFAFVQWSATGGYLFYANAFDEPTYLSWDGARMTRSLTHLAEYLVVGLQSLGLAGGYINLCFDLLLPVLTVVLLRRIARTLDFSPMEASVYPFFVISLGVLFGYANPYYTTLYNLNYYSSGLSWITLPQGYYPPFFRTPEPQLSLCVAALATYLAMRYRSYLIAVAVVPLLYPFVGIPYGFVVVAMWCDASLQRAAASTTARAAAAIAISYAAIAGAILVYYLLFVSGTALVDFLPATHLPLISGTGAAAILLYAAARARIDSRLQAAALFIAVAPLAVANTQVVAGFIQAPHNFEQNFGVVALAILSILGLRAAAPRVVALTGAAILSCGLLAVYATHIFLVNASPWQRLPVPSELIDALQRQPESVVIENADLADVFSLAAPRLHFSALARSQTYRAGADSPGDLTTADRFRNYLCVKREMSRSDEPGATAAFAVLDRGYRYLNQDFPLIHLNRKHEFRQIFDPSASPAQCPARQIQVYPALVFGPELERPTLPRDIATPAARWAFAATADLPSSVTPTPGDVRLLDVETILSVRRGCLGVGALSPDRSKFVSQVLLDASDRSQRADLVFESGPRPHAAVIFNCSPDGASTGTVESIRLFPVRGVSLRTVTARLEADR